MIIEEMRKNCLIHLHVITLWCIRWHGMQQNGHFLSLGTNFQGGRGGCGGGRVFPTTWDLFLDFIYL